MCDPLWLRIALLFFDKLVLAGILAVAVLLGQRWLENYKARQALAQGLVKLRIDAIAKLCDDLAKIELELYDADRRYNDIIKEQARIVATSSPKGEFETLFPEAVDRIATPELVPRLAQVRADLARFAAQVAQPTFWVPESITELLKEHIDSLTSLRQLHHERVVKKQYVPFDEFDATTQLVGRKRLTLDSVIERLEA